LVAKKLVIVESPAKARTVGRFLGKEYVVEASIGHIRDLPMNRLGVDVDDNFRPRYVVPEKKKDVVKKLKALAKEAGEIFLATDPDREGEAISWHLTEALKLGDGQHVQRVEFHEITKEAIQSAFAHPREIDRSLVDAQQARRILDRLVGYKLSPLLRQKVTKKGLSAGRVQSVAVKFVVDREREIEAFDQVEYWTLKAEIAKLKGRSKKPFLATLNQIDAEKIDLKDGETTRRIETDLEGARFVVDEVRKREIQRNPAAPFTTSTLQQEASRKLGFSAKRTMAIAQQLYEGVQVAGEGSVGLITYMRTDSTNIATSAQQQALEFIAGKYGSEYAPPKPRVFKTKSKGAQEAHEAIRPTSVLREPDAIKDDLAADQYRLYRLVWQRFVSSQMAAAVLDSTSVDVSAYPSSSDGVQPKRYLFRASGSVTKFAGFMAVYTEGKDEGDPTAVEEDNKTLPALDQGEELGLAALHSEQHFTQPPPRYTEATLVKALEENGIGRPSTYAPTLSTIQDRGYVERAGKQLQPTFIGLIVNDLLVAHFPDIVDVGFTAQMEEQLDNIASEHTDWVQVLSAFYGPFIETLRRAEVEMPEVALKPEPTGEFCEKCGSELVIKYGRFGKFIACSGYPACRNAKSLMIKVGTNCPKCGGEIVEKKTRRKRLFYSCSNYPACDFAAWSRPLPQAEQPCKECGGLLVEGARGQAKCNSCGATSPRVEAPEATEAVPAGVA
jgi:DNA topoisomerase I